MRNEALLLAFAAAAFASGAAARPSASIWTSGVEDANRGTLKASFQYQSQRDVGPAEFRNERLVVRRDSATLYAGPVCTTDPYPGGCAPANFYTRTRSLFLRSVWGDARPETVLDLNTGGAHCCSVTDAVLERGGRGLFVEHDFGSSGYRGDTRAGTYYFVSADDRFDYEFTDYADSAEPVQVWKINEVARFVDVTRTRLDLVRRDASRLWADYETFRGQHRDPRGVLAAWCGDQYLLGEQAACVGQLQQAVRTGVLAHFGDPQPAQFVALVQRDLPKWGYLQRRTS